MRALPVAALKREDSLYFDCYMKTSSIIALSKYYLTEKAFILLAKRSTILAGVQAFNL
jgi:hypothetical protein